MSFNKKRILLTCPPMIGMLKSFEHIFEELRWEVVVPDFVQTMTENALCNLLPQYEGWIIGDDPATRRVLEAGRKGALRAAVKWGVGTDNVDFTACEQLGISISNTPRMFGAEVADLAMCYILGLARDAFLIDREVRKGRWYKPAGVSLRDCTLGLVGLGDIGSNVAARAHAHGMQIYAWDPYVTSVPQEVNFLNEWPDGIEDCDFLVFTCSLSQSTRHMISRDTLSKCKRGVRIVNVSRGPLIDELALIEGLQTGQVTSAALDVFESEPLSESSPLLDFKNCILGSHNGSNTHQAVTRASMAAIEILREQLETS